MLALTAELSHSQLSLHYTIENVNLSMQEHLLCTGLSAPTFKPRWNFAFKHQHVLVVNRMATRKKQTNKQNKAKTKLPQQQHKQQQKWVFFRRLNFDGYIHVDNRVKPKKKKPTNKRDGFSWKKQQNIYLAAVGKGEMLAAINLKMSGTYRISSIIRVTRRFLTVVLQHQWQKSVQKLAYTCKGVVVVALFAN